ncbi:MAG TPA: heat-inducible transcriptional repressor HrcA [Dissulfurispiraceae bacterium]|jgi:heat-inducible transcriptional repressor|nr:heat-inducible transcriptional repressor HrcA [Dissulfurispiraceae bacterium]
MLDERTRRVLHAVVQSYIGKPEPVGSRFVTKRYSIGFSPATIRNVMADLEELGFLMQPHTSAGRIPTDKGYRFYVDSLRVERIDATEELPREFARQYAGRLERMKSDINLMFAEVTQTLSAMSSYIGVALPPKPERTTFSRIDLLRYRGGSAVALLVTEEGVIKNKILQMGQDLSQGDLNRIADYLNAEYGGKTLDEMRSLIVAKMSAEKNLCDNLITRAIHICEQAIHFADEDVFVSGFYDVMNLPDFSDIAKIKELSRAIRDKHLILRLLQELSEAEGVQVLIGDENPVAELRRLSVVASTYKEGNRPMGVIALIGPTRMNYPRAISMVEAIAKCISGTFENYHHLR